MKRRILSLVAATITAALLVSCTAHIHTVGEGPKGNTVMKQKQWYILFGLVPLNKVDTHAMAGDATNYEIKTVSNVDDVLISIITTYVTVHPRTVIVTK